MPNKILRVIVAKDEFELEFKSNSLKEKVVASQPIQKTDSTWVMFYYVDAENDKLSNEEKPTPNKNWREEPATEPQKKKLDKLKIKYSPDIKKGQASDLINKAEGKR